MRTIAITIEFYRFQIPGLKTKDAKNFFDLYVAATLLICKTVNVV